MNHECHYTTKNSHLSRGRIEKGHYDKKRKVVTIWSRIVAVCVRREARGGSPRVLERERNGLSGWPSERLLEREFTRFYNGGASRLRISYY